MLAKNELRLIYRALLHAQHNTSSVEEMRRIGAAKRIVREEVRRLYAIDTGRDRPLDENAWEADCQALHDTEQGGYERTRAY